MTGVLGLGLGSILVFHRSLWIAVLAHGFFDASTFFFLWWLDRVGLLKDVLK
jgi:membrane protease YdiL (CAAX protease family)